MKTFLTTLVAASFLLGLAGSASAETDKKKNRVQASSQDRNRGNLRKTYGYRAAGKFSKPDTDRRNAGRSDKDRDDR